MPGLVSVEVASGGLRPLFVMVTSFVPFIRDIEEFCVHIMPSSARLKSEKVAVNVKSSLTSKVMFSLSPATGAATMRRIPEEVKWLYMIENTNSLACSMVTLLVPSPRALVTLHMYVPNWSSVIFISSSVISVLRIAVLSCIVHW